MAVFTLPKEFGPPWSGPGVKPKELVKFTGNGDAWLFNKGNYSSLKGQNKVILAGVTPKADYLVCDGESASGVILADSAGKFCKATFTVVVKFDLADLNQYDRIIDCKPVYSSSDGWSVDVGISTTFTILGNGAGTTTLSNAWDFFGGKTKVTLIARYDGVTLEVWTNYGGYAAKTTSLNESATNLHLFKYPFAGGNSPAGNMHYLSLYNELLSDAKIDSLLIGPYQDLKLVNDPVYFIPDASVGGATITTTPPNSIWSSVNASINAQTVIPTTPPNLLLAAVNASINAQSLVSTTPTNSVWAKVKAVIESTTGGATIVTTPANSVWDSVTASINAKLEIVTTPATATWAGVNSSINAKTLITTSVPNANWASIAAVIEAATVIVTTPATATWAGVNASIITVVELGRKMIFDLEQKNLILSFSGVELDENELGIRLE